MSTSTWPHSRDDFISLNYPLYFLVMGSALRAAAGRASLWVSSTRSVEAGPTCMCAPGQRVSPSASWKGREWELFPGLAQPQVRPGHAFWDSFFSLSRKLVRQACETENCSSATAWKSPCQAGLLSLSTPSILLLAGARGTHQERSPVPRLLLLSSHQKDLGGVTCSAPGHLPGVKGICNNSAH